MKKWSMIGITAGLIGLAIWLAYPAYRSWQAQRAAVAALEFVRQTNYAAARLCAARALQFNKHSVVACQVLADLAERAQSTKALSWRERVRQLEPGNVSHHIALAESALVFRQWALARDVLDGLPAAVKQTSTAYHRLAAQLAFAHHDVVAAERHLIHATAGEPENNAHRYNLEIVRLHSSDSNVVGSARERLESGRLDPVSGAAILRALANEALARRDLDRAQECSRDLQGRPEVVFEDRLLHLTILAERTVGSVQTDRTFWTTLAATQAEAMAAPERTVLLLHWLARNGFADAGLDWVEQLPDALRRETAIRRAESECYMAAKKWAELAAVLKASHWGPDEHYRHALLALAARQAGDIVQARIEWKRAVRAGFSASAALLVRLAGAWGWDIEAEELLWDMARDGADRRWALALLCRGYELSGDTRSLLRVYDAALVDNPRELLWKNNCAASSLLVNTNLGSAHRWAREVFQAQPTNATFACTYAYSLHLQGRTAEALQVFTNLPPEALRAPGLAAYYGLILKAQGHADAADRYLALALANPGRLLPEERELVRQCVDRR